MISMQLRRFLVAVLVAALSFSASPFGAAPVGAATLEPTITFFGGGWGHGIGMSQYGALGRAQAGHSYQQILAHYYPNTTLEPVGGFGVTTVDVLLERRSTVAVSRPWTDGVPQAGWKVELRAGGELIATATQPVTATYANGTWSATVRERDTNGNVVLDANGAPKLIELCTAKCTGALSFRVVGGTHVVVEKAEGGDNVGVPGGTSPTGAYRGGEIRLHPGALGGGCGGAGEFCVMHAGVDLQQYVKGIAEIPRSWPIEAQKAQAVAARSYAASAIIRRAGNGNAWDVENSVNDQYYLGYGVELAGCGNWCPAVDATAGVVAVHAGKVAETYYSSSNGGHSAEPQDVWASGSSRPYLPARPDGFDGNPSNANAARDHVYGLADVSRWLRDHGLDVGTVSSIDIDAPPSGRVSFATVRIQGTKTTVTVQGHRLYEALRNGCLATPGCDALKSTNFAIRSVNPYIDVRYSDYFYLPVQWMTTEAITTGVAPAWFGPQQTNNRAQLATFLWRFAGRPAPAGPSGFTDVRADSFYEDAVAWMKEMGITTGTSRTRFSPDGTVTRAQAAAFLWRFAGEPESTERHAFTDVAANTYYTEAVRWMVEHDLTTGTTPTTFAPNEVLTRGQIATFLWRLADAPAAFADDVDLPDAMRATE